MVTTAVRLPSSLVRREASLASTGYSTWVLARANKDYALFAPVLQEWIEIKRERGRLIDADKPLYDVLADEYSQGMTSARITAIFEGVKKDLAPFLSKLKQHGKRPDVKCLQGKFDVKAQEALGRPRR
jgi:carboxypeptidase Taq